MNRILIGATLVVAGTWTRAATAAEGAPPSARGAHRTTGLRGAVGCGRRRSLRARRQPRGTTGPGAARCGGGETRHGRRLVAQQPDGRRDARTAHSSRPGKRHRLELERRASQELEIAGQRGARLDVADAETAAQARRVGGGGAGGRPRALCPPTTKRSRPGRRSGSRAALVQTAQALATYAEARAKEALIAGVDADVARAEATRIGLARFEAERRLPATRTALAVLLDVDERRWSSGHAPGGRRPPTCHADPSKSRRSASGARSPPPRWSGRFSSGGSVIVRRERIPNPTLSAFAERGGFDDQISRRRALGADAAPRAGRPHACRRDRRDARADPRRRELRRARPPPRAPRGCPGAQRRFRRAKRARLCSRRICSDAGAPISAALREGISSRQLSLREGLQWQRSFIELLQGDIEARLGRALAWVELRRVVGPAARAPATGGAR